jgi:hypothetical protein
MTKNKEEMVLNLYGKIVQMYNAAIEFQLRNRGCDVIEEYLPEEYFPPSLKKFEEFEPFIFLHTNWFAFGAVGESRGVTIGNSDDPLERLTPEILVVAADCLEAIWDYICDEAERATLQHVANKLENMTALRRLAGLLVYKVGDDAEQD